MAFCNVKHPAIAFTGANCPICLVRSAPGVKLGSTAIELLKDNLRMELMSFLVHSKCGQVVSVAAMKDDVAIYVYCDTCKDIVEDGELRPTLDESKVRLRVDQERVRIY